MTKDSLSFIISPSNDLVKTAMKFRKARNEMINSNIANIDTPFYKSKDIRFENFLAQKAQEAFRDEESTELQLAKNSVAHLDPKNDISTSTYLFYRDGHMVRNDGNSVDLDTETTEMAKNTSAYKALSALAKKQSGLFKYAIESSSKLA